MLLEKIAIPVSKRSPGRTPETNPFVDDEGMFALIKAMPVNAPEGTPDAGLAVSVPGILDKSNKELLKVQRQITAAGLTRDPQVTMRKLTKQVVGADDKPAVRIEFFAVTLMKRESRKEKEARLLAETEANAAAQNADQEDFPENVLVSEDGVSVAPKPSTRSGRTARK